MKIRDRHNIVKRFLLITSGSVIYAAAISLFLDPNHLVPGGVSGIAIMINHLAGWAQTGTLIILINIPLLALGLWKFGKHFLFSTVYSTFLSSALINLISSLAVDLIPLTDNPLLAGLAGGALLSLGLGMVFRGGGTTGGADIIIKLIRLKYKHIKTGSIFLIFDTVVVALSALVFRNIETALYSAVVLIVSSRVLDLVLYGSDSAKLIYIISDRPDEIAEQLLKKVGLGVTYLEGEGAYSKKNKRVLMCASRKQSFPKIREVVTDTDPMSFMIVSGAQEIFGEGFKNYKSADL